MGWLSKNSRQLLLELSVGVVLYNLLLGILAWFFLPRIAWPVMPVLKGLLLGGAGAIAMLVHIAIMTERVLDSQNESYANKTTVLYGMIRKLVFIAAVIFCWQFFRIDLLATVLGAMGMKAGAYLQPLVHKVFRRKSDSV